MFCVKLCVGVSSWNSNEVLHYFGYNIQKVPLDHGMTNCYLWSSALLWI